VNDPGLIRSMAAPSGMWEEMLAIATSGEGAPWGVELSGSQVAALSAELGRLRRVEREAGRTLAAIVASAGGKVTVTPKILHEDWELFFAVDQLHRTYEARKRGETSG
jgi:hypothetical protein